jgi:hypothetical protein
VAAQLLRDPSQNVLKVLLPIDELHILPNCDVVILIPKLSVESLQTCVR